MKFKPGDRIVWKRTGKIEIVYKTHEDCLILRAGGYPWKAWFFELAEEPNDILQELL